MWFLTAAAHLTGLHVWLFLGQVVDLGGVAVLQGKHVCLLLVAAFLAKLWVRHVEMWSLSAGMLDGLNLSGGLHSYGV